MSSFLFTLFLLTCFSPIIFAQCPTGGVYISPQGNDTTGTGESDKPFQKLVAAFNKIRPNGSGVICVQAGNYSEENLVGWQGPSRVIIQPVDTMNRPLFSTLNLNVSNIDLVLQGLSFGSSCGVFAYNSSNVTLTDTNSPSTAVDIFQMSPYGYSNFTLSLLKVKSLSVAALSTNNPTLIDVQVFNSSVLGNVLIFGSSNAILSQCNFSGPVNLGAVTALTKQCLFSFMNTNRNVLYLSTVAGIKAVHTLQNNSFINNTITGSADSVIGYFFNGDTNSITLTGNRFSCNMNVKNNKTSVAQGIPEYYYIDGWVIDSSNTFDPSCPFICPPGQEIKFGGIAGCALCQNGFISPGNTTPCTPCPAGTASQFTQTNCSQCSPGYIAPGPNNTRCSLCYSGTSSPNYTACVPCPSNYYSLVGLCNKCTDDEPYHNGCLNCGIFTSVDSDCKELSLYGIVIIAVCGGFILFVPLVVVVYHCLRKKEYKPLN